MMKQVIQTSMFNTPSKKEKKKFVNDIMELFGTFKRPIIVMPGYEDMAIPKDIKNQITTERLICALREEKTATNIETMWYLSTASLVAPLGQSWYRFYLKLFREWCINVNKELPGFAKEEIVLEKFEEYELKRLRNWLYKKSVEGLKQGG